MSPAMRRSFSLMHEPVAQHSALLPYHKPHVAANVTLLLDPLVICCCKRINLRTVTCVIMLLGILRGVDGWFCYTHEIESGSSSIQFCPTVSCFSVGGSILGLGVAQKGCADQYYPSICQAMDFKGIAGEHVCFCNTFLCNASSMPAVFLPLLLFPYLLQTLM